MHSRLWPVSFLLIALVTLSAVGQEPVYTDNVVIVLDGSGSMRQKLKSTGVAKIDAAKSALHEVLAQLPETTHVGVIAFSTASKEDWLVPLGPQDASQLKSAIDALKANGGTPLGRYMKRGADRLLEQRASQYGYGTYRLLIVTDGEAQDQEDVNAYTPDIISRGITVDVIGVDMATDHTLATRVHSYRRADDPDSLRTAIAEVFAEVSASDDSDTAGEDAFAVLAPLPNEIALAAVQALATSGNAPVGQQPMRETSKVAPPAPPSRSSGGPSNGPPDAFPGTPITRSSSSGGGTTVFCLGTTAVLVVVVAIVLAKRGRP